MVSSNFDPTSALGAAVELKSALATSFSGVILTKRATRATGMGLRTASFFVSS